MSETRSFHGPPTTGGKSDRRVAGLAVVLLVAFVGVAIAKPWGAPVSPSPTTTPSAKAVALPIASLPTTASEVPSAASPSALRPSAVATFTTSVPPPATAAWSALRWRRLAQDDPLTLVTSVIRWSGGFLAVGWSDIGSPTTPVWTSQDGSHWDPLPFNTSTTFWPGALVAGVAEVPTGLVVLTVSVSDCAGACSLKYGPPQAWTSADGREWAPHVLSVGSMQDPTGSPPLLAIGPSGLVAASTGPAARLAISTDGTHWLPLPATTLPSSFVLNALVGTATGYVAAGRSMAGGFLESAVALWSGNGRRWSATPSLLPASPLGGPDVGSAVTALVVGRDGLIAVGRGVASPGASLWWSSTDGRSWALLPTFAPLGATTCTGEGCGLRPAVGLVGDGQRLLAVRGGPNAGAWQSLDGQSWQRLSVSGEIPSPDATQATLLPGGVLLTDGSTTWYGEAVIG